VLAAKVGRNHHEEMSRGEREVR